MFNLIKALVVFSALSASVYADELNGFDIESVSQFGGKVEFIDGAVVLFLPYKFHFDFDESEIKAMASAKALAAFLINSTEPMTLVIDGHTDEVGTDSYNMNLSTRRADELKSFLVDQGLSEERIDVVGLSKSVPMERTGEASRKNRRLELSILRK